MSIRINISNCERSPDIVRKSKGRSMILFPETYVVVDTETTGLSPSWDALIEIGGVKYQKGMEVGRFQSLIQPPSGPEIDPFITAFTGITPEMLKEAPGTEEVLSRFADFLEDNIIVGYNAGFDINFLYDNFLRFLHKPLTNDYIDAMRMARKLYPERKHHRLVDMVDMFGIKHDHAHRAISDVYATQECFQQLQRVAQEHFGTTEEFYKSFSKVYSGIKAGDIVGDADKANPESPIYGRYCVFTGKLERFTRKEAMQIVADLGGINEDSITKNTNYLILGNNDYCTTIHDGKSSKHKKAEKLKLNGQDIEIIPEAVFYGMLIDM